MQKSSFNSIIELFDDTKKRKIASLKATLRLRGISDYLDCVGYEHFKSINAAAVIDSRLVKEFFF